MKITLELDLSNERDANIFGVIQKLKDFTGSSVIPVVRDVKGQLVRMDEPSPKKPSMFAILLKK